MKQELERLGHHCTSRWITEVEFGGPRTAEMKAHAATTDIEDVEAATDGLILLAESPGTYVPGGKHVELGYALALHRPVFVVGVRENTLQFHPRVRHFGSPLEFFEFLKATTSQEKEDVPT